MNTTRVKLPKKKIADFCRKWGVCEFSLFGSVLRDDYRPDSDLDVLVDFKPGVEHTLLDLVSMTEELKAIFGREVDLLTRKAVENSENYIRRKAILSSLEVVYAS